jgi:hypothetical protein
VKKALSPTAKVVLSRATTLPDIPNWPITGPDGAGGGVLVGGGGTGVGGGGVLVGGGTGVSVA